MDGCKLLVNKKGKPCFSNENAMTDFRKTWYVSGGASTTHVVCCHQMYIFNTSFAYLLANNNNKKKAYIQSSVWATVTKLGISTTHVVYHH